MTREIKNSGVQWLPVIPCSWKMGRIKNIIDILTDYTANGSFADLAKNVQYLDYEDYARLVRLTDLRENLENDGIYVSQDSYEYLSKSKLFGGEILIANVGAYAGLFCEMPEIDKRATLGPNMFLVRTNQHMLQHYLLYLGNSRIVEEQLTQKAVSAAQPKLNKNDLKTVAIPIPCIKEQQKIAEYLDKKCGEIDSILSDVQSQINLLEDYKKSVITEAVTKGLNPDIEMTDSGIEWIGKIPKHWETNRIKNIFRNGKGLPITKENLIDEGLAVVSYGQIHSKTNTGVMINDDMLRFVDYKYQKYYPQCQVYQYDFIFADTSEDIEGCGNCIYKRDSSELFAGYHAIILHSIVPQDNRYLAYLFKTDCWRKQIREAASGVKVFSITQKMLINSSVIVPSFEERQKIADYLDKKCAEIDATIAEKREQLNVLEQYKKSMIYEYVTGKKEVQ